MLIQCVLVYEPNPHTCVKKIYNEVNKTKNGY